MKRSPKQRDGKRGPGKKTASQSRGPRKSGASAGKSRGPRKSDEGAGQSRGPRKPGPGSKPGGPRPGGTTAGKPRGPRGSSARPKGPRAERPVDPDKPRGSRAEGERKHRHTGARAVIRSLPEPELYQLIEATDEPLVLILDSIEDPHNLGACLRTAEGAGVTAVVVPKHHASPLTETVRQVACGAAERVPVVQATNLTRVLEELKGLGVWSVATADDAERNLYELDLTGGIALVLGAEGDGVRRLVRETCDFAVRIPMAGEVECLNVSVSAGVCLYEAVRQRRVR